MAKRPCLEPGCGVLTDGTRCTKHERDRDQARGTRQQRGYDNEHDKLRARWQHKLDAGQVIHCWRPGCGKVINPKHWHLGHDDNDRTKYRGPECVPCNTATKGR